MEQDRASAVLLHHQELAWASARRAYEVIVNLIANTRTRAGLRIRAEPDQGKYPTGIKVPDVQLNALNLKQAEFHGDWNYAILPQRKK